MAIKENLQECEISPRKLKKEKKKKKSLDKNTSVREKEFRK